MRSSNFIFIFVLLGSILLASTATGMEKTRIAILGSNVPDARINALKKGLSENGYIVGKNIDVEYRKAKKGDLSNAANDIVNSDINIIVAAGTPATRAAQKATTTTPIVMHCGNPVATGFAKSLDKPGGNITGLTVLVPRFYTKRLELLQEAVPTAQNIAVFWNPGNKSHKVSLAELQEDAARSGLSLFPIEIKDTKDIAQAFTDIKNKGSDGLIVFGDALFATNKKQITSATVDNKIPAIYTSSQFVKAGGLMSYGVHMGDLYHRMGWYIARIISGVDPANLPIETPQKFDISINLKSARQIGLKLPDQLLARANSKFE